MGLGLTLTAADVYAPTEPGGAPRSPVMSDARDYHTAVEAILDAVNGSMFQGFKVFLTVASLNANLNYDADTGAIVYADPGGPLVNGKYRKIGASGMGSWSRIEGLEEGARNLFPDPFWRRLSAGEEVIDGNPTWGRNNIGNQLLDGSTVSSPFKTQVLWIPLGSAAIDHDVDIRHLGIKNGETLHVAIGYNASATIQSTVSFHQANGTIVGSAVTAFKTFSGYNELYFQIPVTGTTVANAAYMKIRHISGGALGSHISCIGIGIYKRPTALVDSSFAEFVASQKLKSPLAGKKILLLGDSIMSPPYTIGARAAELLGCTIVQCGFGGTVLSTHPSADYDPFSGAALVAPLVSGTWTTQDTKAALIGGNYPASLAVLKAQDLDDFDEVWFAFGQNDFGLAACALGKATDTTRATLMGAIHVAVSTLQTAFDHLTIRFIAPYYRTRIAFGDGLEADANANSSGIYLQQFVDAMRHMCARRRVPCLDLYRASNVNAYTAADRLLDGLHPAPAGEREVANIIAGWAASGIAGGGAPGGEWRPWTPTLVPTTGSFTSITYDAIRAGHYVISADGIATVRCLMRTDAITVGTASGILKIPSPVPARIGSSAGVGRVVTWAGEHPCVVQIADAGTEFNLLYRTAADGAMSFTQVSDLGTGADANLIDFTIQFPVW